MPGAAGTATPLGGCSSPAVVEPVPEVLEGRETTYAAKKTRCLRLPRGV